MVIGRDVILSGNGLFKLIHGGFLEHGQTKDLKDLVETGRETQSFLDNGDKNVGCANDPDLQLGHNLRRSEERVDPQRLREQGVLFAFDTGKVRVCPPVSF